MARISEHTIEQVRSHADIVDVVSQYVELKKKGRNFFGLCPFHSEKTASFSVNPEKQIYHCFGCGAGGGSIQFIMQMESLEFIDAIKYLADKLNISIQFDKQSGTRQLYVQLEEMHHFTQEFYHRHLFSPGGKEALEHLKARGLTEETIKKFRLGFSPAGWQTLLDVVRKKDFTPEALLQSGLFVQSDRGSFDRFRSRIMFPIHNHMGKTVAFAGRVFQTDDPAKYVNSPETPIYHKGKTLYGLWAVKSHLRDKDTILVVEGYLDFLQLYQAEIRNIIAVSGTAFTDDHAREIRKYSKKVTLAYDGDSAGIAAAIRAGYVLLKNELEPFIVDIPHGMDPDDWIKKDGAEPFLSAVRKAQGLIQFHARHFGEDLTNPASKTRFTKAILREIAAIPDEITRQVYIQHLASVNRIPEQALYRSMEQMKRTSLQRGNIRSKADKGDETPVKSASAFQPLEEELILLCFAEDFTIRALVSDHMDSQWFQSELLREIYDQVSIHLRSEAAPNSAMILDNLENDGARRKLTALIWQLDKRKPSIQIAVDTLRRLEDRQLRNELEKVRSRLKETELKNENFTHWIMEFERLKKQRLELKKKYASYLPEETPRDRSN